MASDAGFVQFVVDQIGDAGDISWRKMFGDYALYCNTKVVALICDNQLFVKPTREGDLFHLTSEVAIFRSEKSLPLSKST